MKKAESVRENPMHKIPRDFETLTDHLIPSGRSNLILINKKERVI